MPATIGASEVAVVLGLQRTRISGEPYVSELEVFARLIGELDRYDDNGGPSAELGRWFEHGVAARYIHELGLDLLQFQVRPGPSLREPGLAAPGVPWHSRPDLLNARDNLPVELKAPEVLDERYGPDDDDAPPEHTVQSLCQLAVCNRLYGSEESHIGVMPRLATDDRTWTLYRLQRHPQREQRMIRAVEDWLDRHVRCSPPKPPPPDGSRSAHEALRWLWSNTDETERYAERDDVELHRSLLQSRTALAEMKARHEERRQQLQARMGPAHVLRSNEGRVLATFKPTKRGRLFSLYPRQSQETVSDE